MTELSDALKLAINQMLAGGASAQEVIDLCGKRGGMSTIGIETAEACRIYIESKVKEQSK